MMDIENFASILLKSIGKAGLSIADVERLDENKCLFGIELSDKSEFLLKIGERRRRNAEQEMYSMELDEMDSKISDIYEQYINSWEFNDTMVHNKFDIDWLKRELELDDYLKLEDHILGYCSRNDEFIFRLGFKYAWSLFHECMQMGAEARA